MTPSPSHHQFAKTACLMQHSLTSLNVMSLSPVLSLSCSPNHFNIRLPGFQPKPFSRFGRRLQYPQSHLVSPGDINGSSPTRCLEQGHDGDRDTRLQLHKKECLNSAKKVKLYSLVCSRGEKLYPLRVNATCS
ncbi:hypothetical protein P5673_011406 [Acropora cervicornis]|uniref:Uncharacterized protein n=1 Tax=Acropora cervicornis TaxID=6130 RepID=A0AAD9QPG4_ACRCE|nr:hypothetical protein P5673_011406 [Acropora cervicornis]